jgi:DNA-binding HxlR family transcriptional regulator
MRYSRYNQTPICAVELCLEVIGGKWKGAILSHLLGGTKRFGELRRLMPAVTQRMLTTQLRELEDDGVIVRTVHPQLPPKVEYALSGFGHALAPIIALMQTWGSELLAHKSEIQSGVTLKQAAGERALIG